MKVAAKWKIAALTLVTVPTAFWLAPNSMGRTSKALIVLAFVPSYIALGIELRETWKRALESSASSVEGSPAGNKLAVALAIMLLIGFVLWALLYVLAPQHT